MRADHAKEIEAAEQGAKKGRLPVEQKIEAGAG
jgi:hypothetical protein